MIAEYGDEAYHKAVELAVVGVRVEDSGGAGIYSEIAIELMQRGYHKKGRDRAGNEVTKPELLRVREISHSDKPAELITARWLKWRLGLLVSVLMVSVGSVLIGQGNYNPGIGLAMLGAWLVGALTKNVEG
jgi:hypothetical protein